MTTNRLSIRRQGFVSILLLAALVLSLPAWAVRVIYVDHDASHFSPDGTTWERAYRQLQQGLNASKTLRNSLGSDTEPIEVWVAEGTYVPTEARGGMGWTGNGRNELGFTLFGRNIQIYGGFTGTEASRDERDFIAHPCVLDGEDLSYHVIYVDQDEQVNETVVLDGFTVRRGRAMGDQCCGDNRGGAMTFQSARMTVINCLFEDNQAGDEGGAVFTFSSGSTFINCRFYNNRSWGGDGVGGGAVWATGSTTFINCAFAGNRVGNSSFGGALVANQPVIVNCVFHDNISGRDFNNDDQPYGALHLQSLNTGNAQVTNTILWNNRTDQGVLKQISGFSIQNNRVTYCNIQGGWTGGTANIDQDPLFVDAANRDFNLDTGSPCIDAGNSGALPADSFDIDHDGDTTERIPYDLQLAPRFMDDAVVDTGTDGGTGLPVVEMGAYERPRDCDQNGIPDVFEIRDGTAQDCNDNGIIDVCETDPGDPDGDGETAPDCNGNGIPDECEVEGGLCPEGCLSDCNGNGVPDECDVAGGCSFTLSLLDNTTGLADGRVLGPPDDRWIGIGGQTVTFDWRCGRIADGPGVDFVVYEADSNSAEFDQINVLVSRNGTDFESVKTSETAPVPIPGDDNHGDPAFARGYDIGSKGFDWVRYVRLEGAGDEPGGDNTGFDLDAVGAVYPEPTSEDCDGNGIPDECGLSFDGLFATYYDNDDLSGPGVSRRDPRVDFDWGDGSPAAGIGPDTWSARWQAALTPPATDLYTFFVEAGGGARLWIGGVLRIDAWTAQPVTEHSSAQVELAQGVPVDLVLEYFNDTGDAVAQLRWKPFNGNKGYIPTSALSYTIADCNGNGLPDACDIADGTSTDCNGNGIPDECDIEGGTSADCNNNGLPDECEVAADSTAPGGPFYCTQDCNPDCNDNGIPDDCDIGFGTSTDCNANGIPDECEIASGAAQDCNHNGIPDECDISSGTSIDCNFNGRPDDCDIADDPGLDTNGDGFIDACSLFVGDEIQPPSGYTSQVEPAIDPGTKAFWHPSEKKVFTKEQGSVNIGWIEEPGARTAAAPTVAVATVTYGILPATPTVSIYLTDPPPRSGPAVDLTNILQGTPRVRPIVHFNSTFTSNNDAWVDVLNQLRVSKLGSFLFEYREEFGDQRLVAFEVVQVRPPEADYIVAVEVGDELRPSSTDEVSCRPAVTRGLLPPSPFVFQVNEAGPTQDRAFAIRPTDNPINMEVYWLRESYGGVCWPFELTRYTATWPTAPQLNVFGPGDIPKVDMSAHEQAIIEYQTPAGHGVISDRKLTVTGPGWATIRYSDPVTEGRLVQFEVARTIAHDGEDPSLDPPVQWPIQTPWEIGEALADPVHDTGCFPSGYIYSGTAYDGSIYSFGGAESRIIPVNRGAIEVWWHRTSLGVCWPVKPVRYDCDWPAVPDHCLVIANEQGVGPFSPSKYLNPSIYELGGIADDPDTVGYNPNEEHAEWVTNPGDPIYAARDDYNAVHGRSEPYVLLKYRNNLLPDKPWEFDLIRVARSIANGPVGGCTCAVEPCDFVYPVTAGTPLFPPAPLVFRTLCQENRLTDESLLWDDDKGNKWFRRGQVTVDAEYFENWRSEGCMPWLDDGTGDPQDVTWNVGWPQIAADPPRIVGGPAQNIYTPLAFGATRDRSTFASAEILYNDSGAVLIKPWTVTAVPLLRDSLPDEYLSLYNKLAPHLRARLSYDDVNEELRWAGVASQNLLGIMSEADRDGILAVFEAAPDGEGFNAAVGALHLATQQSGAGDVGTYLGPPRRERDDPDWSSSWGIALSAGSATSEGWIVVGYNGNADIPDPVQVEVFRVGCPPDAGLIFVVEPDCPFDEQLTLRWSGDCGGDCKDFEFYWQVAAGDNPDDYDDIDPGSAPGDKPPFNPWEDYTDPERDNASGWVRGQNEIVIRGANIRTLTDNWFHVMVRVPPDTNPAATACVPGATSGFTPAQLAEGWIKRVKRALNPFDQRIKNFTDTRVQTYVSMIEQLGNPYIDTINLSCRADVVNRLGLIELYQAVLLRGRSFTVDQGLRYPPANQALMLISGNLVDFYMLLGNEAYGDSLDPMVTIDVGTSAPPTSIFAFQDQLPTNENSLLYEELALLRGRDGRSGTPLDRFPVHNRLYWNFTSGDGQVAYRNAYDIQDVYPETPDGSRGDGFFTEDDARVMFPQGHGDAWGHYLTGIRFYYDLLRHTSFDWENRAEAVLVDQVPVQVSYAHERRFARTAAARARTAESIMDLTYREHYSEDPSKQWQGYPDPVAGRHWGVFDWGQRAMQGAYFDWLVGNASVPAVDDDPDHAGTIKRVDRTTVTALGEIASHADAIQTLLDQADAGLNPLGLAKNVVPFDIDPTLLASQTHFEQVYNRATHALTNAVNVFNHANQASQSLRRTADEAQQFENNVEDREADFTSRLIEIFGSPFPDDRNPLTGELYGTDFNGPDLYHWMYIEEEELLGVSLPAGRTLTLDFRVLSVDPDTGALDRNTTVSVPYNVVPGFGLMKPGSWTRPRRAPGDLQLAQSEMVQALRRFEQARVEYDTLIRDIEDQAELLEKNYDVRRDQLQIRERQRNRTIWFNSALTVSKGIQLTQARVAQVTDRTSEIISDCLPKIVGLSNDVSSPVSCGIKQAGFSFSLAFAIAADIAALSDVGIAGAKEVLAQQTEIDLVSLQGEYDKLAALKELEQKIRSLRAKEVELFSLVQAMRQRNAAYMQLLARGKRILDDRTAFRQQTAEAVSNYRYKDMAFRIFRNDALQKYRAQFDLAARYTYLAARAFEYETNLLHSDALSGEGLLSAVVRERVLGDVTEGVPHQGPGLAGTLASLNDNFQVLKGQLGFNNPTLATNKFSLRRELFRIHPEASTGDEVWRETLRRHAVRDLRTEVPEFDQFISPFAPYDVINGEPAIVLEFRTAVQSDINFFGQPGSTSGGESFFPSDYFSIKVRGVGVWFTEYDAGASGLSATPRCYLVPIGSDIMRIPFTRDLTGGQQLRVWDVVDQILPLPNNLTAAQFAPRQNGWRPANQLPGTLLQAQTRRYPSIGVYPDLRAGQNDVNLAEFDLSTQLVGRSVWNDKWLLIIPGRFLLQGNPAEGVRRFIEGNAGNGGVADIRLAFQTYQYAGAGAAQSADVPLAVLSTDEPAPVPPPAADFRAQLADILAGESVSEPSMLIFGRLRTPAGTPIRAGQLRFEFTPEVGGNPLSVIANLEDFAENVDYLARLPLVAAPAGDTAALELGARYTARVFYDDTELARQLDEPFVPRRGSILGPLDYQTGALTPTATPTRTPTPTYTHTPSGPVVGEVGRIATVTQQWQQVNLALSYTNPVVICGPPSYDESAPAAVRLRLVGGNRFQVRLAEPGPCEDGVHLAETVDYLVIEAGTYELPDGFVLEAGTRSTAVHGGSVEDVSFAMAFAEAPVVLAQVQTSADAAFVRARLAELPSTTGFRVGLEAVEGAGPNCPCDLHTGAETIGWVAVSRGSGTVEGNAVDAGRTEGTFTDNWHTVTFGQTYAAPPLLLAQLQSRENADPAGLRYRNLAAEALELKVEEDDCADAEVSHPGEVVGYVAFARAGLLTEYATPGPTDTPGGPTHTPTATPTPSDTPGGPTSTPTSTATITPTITIEPGAELPPKALDWNGDGVLDNEDLLHWMSRYSSGETLRFGDVEYQMHELLLIFSRHWMAPVS